MALTPSGTISLGDINTALGRSSTASISMNDAQVRFIANQDSGSVTMSAMQNKYNFNGTITVGTANPGFGYDVYGYEPSFPIGSITGGTLWDGATVDAFVGTSIPNSGIESFSATVAFPNVSMRIKVGSNSAVAMTKNGAYRYENSTTAAIVSANVGSTLNWQFSQT